MFSNDIYAQLALDAYEPSKINKVELPDGWRMRGEYETDDESSFLGAIYTNGTKAVVAFAGTDDPVTDTKVANMPLALGYNSLQLKGAVDLYFEALSEFSKDNITFTGHSLGGGLASILSILFDVESVVFDPAPFENSAYAQEAMIK